VYLVVWYRNKNSEPFGKTKSKICLIGIKNLCFALKKIILTKYEFALINQVKILSKYITILKFEKLLKINQSVHAYPIQTDLILQIKIG